ncbi:hypothetical protein B0H66DRAFT_190315 [Apodospora peruviana]|uniref:Uncharacterized protein n=1 Tax=Apodospora peruviana TaxID=516989 RepID=A0AAE0M8R2_9PEZI|nr:hypothetical protein B0H66DRAFT_190315 [Apodospora peruviana]
MGLGKVWIEGDKREGSMPQREEENTKLLSDLPMTNTRIEIFLGQLSRLMRGKSSEARRLGACCRNRRLGRQTLGWDGGRCGALLGGQQVRLGTLRLRATDHGKKTGKSWIAVEPLNFQPVPVGQTCVCLWSRIGIGLTGGLAARPKQWGRPRAESSFFFSLCVLLVVLRRDAAGEVEVRNAAEAVARCWQWSAEVVAGVCSGQEKSQYHLWLLPKCKVQVKESQESDAERWKARQGLGVDCGALGEIVEAANGALTFATEQWPPVGTW